MFLALFTTALMLAAAPSGTAKQKRVGHKTVQKAPTANPRLAFLDQELKKRKFGDTERRDILARPELTLPLVKPKEEFVSWTEFLRRLKCPESIARGKEYLEKNRQTLDTAFQRFRVPPESITAVVRVETDLGKNFGDWEIYKLFYQRAVSRTYRQWKWAAMNFAALAAYCRDAQTDCFSLRGSREGALGLVQFLPYTLEHYGVSAKGSGAPNLYAADDANLSAANFLQTLKWQQNPSGALARYYGSPHRYPEVVLAYAYAIGQPKPNQPKKVVAVTRKAKKQPTKKAALDLPSRGGSCVYCRINADESADYNQSSCVESAVTV